jgi:pyrroline-5-carboxylate reductase
MLDLATVVTTEAATILGAPFFADNVVAVITRILQVVGAGTALYALVHSVSQRADAFTAAGKLSKPAWVGINAAALLVTVLSGVGPGSILGIIAVTAVLVYIVDVRPAVREVSGGGSSW